MKHASHSEHFDFVALRHQAATARAQATAELVHGIKKVVGRAVRRYVVEPYRRWRVEEQARFELYQADDRILRDIGINRAEIDYVIRHGVERRPVANANRADNRAA